MRILYVCRGRPGLGHVMPALAVDSAFRSLNVDYSSLFATYALGCVVENLDVDCQEISFPYNGVGYPGLQVLRGLWPSLNKIVVNFNPDIIVSSGEFLLPIYGLVEKKKIVMLTNSRYFRAETGYFFEIRSILSWLSEKSDLIIDYSIDGLAAQSDLVTNTVYTGPIIRQNINLNSKLSLRRKLELPDDKKIVLVTKGGGEEFSQDAIAGKGSRSDQETLNLSILQKAFEIAKTRHDFYFVFITGMGNVYDIFRQEIEQVNIKCRCLKFEPNILDFLQVADVVIGRGGVNTIGEAVCCNCPQILIPIHTDDEQLSNATFLASHGAAIKIPTNELSSTVLLDALVMILENPIFSHGLVTSARKLFPYIDNAPQIAAKAILQI